MEGSCLKGELKIWSFRGELSGREPVVLTTYVAGSYFEMSRKGEINLEQTPSFYFVPVTDL